MSADNKPILWQYQTHHHSHLLKGRPPWDDIEVVRRKVKRWADRRDYPISWRVDNFGVYVTIAAPTNTEHNKAVRSLGRTLDKHATPALI